MNHNQSKTPRLHVALPVLLLCLWAVVATLSSCASTNSAGSDNLPDEEEQQEIQAENAELRESIAELQAQITTLELQIQQIDEEAKALSNAQQLRIAELEAKLSQAQQLAQRYEAALEQAEYSAQLFAAQNAPREQNQRSTETQSSVAEQFSVPQEQRTSESTGQNPALRVAQVFDPSAIGRSPFEFVGGSQLLVQNGSDGSSYISHRNAGPGTSQALYLEIQQRSQDDARLFLVAQEVIDYRNSSIDIQSVELRPEGSAAIELAAPSKIERLQDSSTEITRLYILLSADQLRMFGRMINNSRGTIALIGTELTREIEIDRQWASRMREVLAVYIELNQ